MYIYIYIYFYYVYIYTFTKIRPQDKNSPHKINLIDRLVATPFPRNVKLTMINRVAIAKFRRASPGHQYYKQY